MLKLGIIGTNWITDQFIEAAEFTKKFTLHSVYSRTLDTAEKFAEKYAQHVACFDDMNAFLQDDQLDVVYIASPNSLHFSQAKQVMEQGKNVIVEKPAFSNPREMEEIIQLAATKKVFFFEAIRNIHDKSFEVIEEVVRQKEVWGANLNFAKYSSRMDAVLAGEEPNIFSLKFSGGALMDLGVYLIYPAVALFGVPKSVHYIPHLLPTGVDGNACGVLKYENFHVTFFVGKNVKNEQGSEFYFNDGTLVVDEMGDVRELTLLNHNGEKTNLAVERFDNPMVFEVSDIADILLHPDKAENIEKYEELTELARNVNQVMYDLRMSCGLTFPSDSKE